MALFSYHSRLSDPPTAYAHHSARRTDQGGLRDIEPLADLLSRDLFVSHQGLKLGHVFFIDRPDPTTFSYGPKASHRSLMGELSLELGQGPKDVKSKPALGGRRVGPSVKETKSDALLLEALHLEDQVLQGAPEPIETPDHERVSIPEALRVLLGPGCSRR